MAGTNLSGRSFHFYSIIQKHCLKKPLNIKPARKLEQEDVKGILDQRQGQRQDYRFTPETKAELIQQFVFEAVAQRPTGGQQLAKKLEERCQLTLSARSI
ncbi:MAG: hypothetical protein GY850_34205 [bacterium]|nr:hypothetical protein [bacterium]